MTFLQTGLPFGVCFVDLAPQKTRIIVNSPDGSNNVIIKSLVLNLVLTDAVPLADLWLL